jgi:hypothetical protein
MPVMPLGKFPTLIACRILSRYLVNPHLVGHYSLIAASQLDTLPLASSVHILSSYINVSTLTTSIKENFRDRQRSHEHIRGGRVFGLHTNGPLQTSGTASNPLQKKGEKAIISALRAGGFLRELPGLKLEDLATRDLRL